MRFPGIQVKILLLALNLTFQKGTRLPSSTEPSNQEEQPKCLLTMSLPAKRCGRPPVLSCLEKKKRKQSLDRRRGKTRIYVGNHIDRWLTLKEKLDFRNDAEVAGFLLDLYDNYDPLSKASICSLPEDVRRITVKGERELPDDTSLIAADGTYDNDDQLSKESTCSGLEDVRIITVKEERDLPDDCSTETDDTVVFLEATTPSVDSTDFFTAIPTVTEAFTVEIKGASNRLTNWSF
ncbi:uncharacterized protein RBU57_014448 isoform 2-T2 [Macrochelys suwanniensis]